MQIVIKIDEDVFTRLFDNGTQDYAIVNDDLFAVAKSIRNGKPLPEHHGRLIDKDKMIADLLTVNPQFKELIDWCLQVTEAQPTIIEADREE